MDGNWFSYCNFFSTVFQPNPKRQSLPLFDHSNLCWEESWWPAKKEFSDVFRSLPLNLSLNWKRGNPQSTPWFILFLKPILIAIAIYQALLSSSRTHPAFWWWGPAVAAPSGEPLGWVWCGDRSTINRYYMDRVAPTFLLGKWWVFPLCLPFYIWGVESNMEQALSIMTFRGEQQLWSQPAIGWIFLVRGMQRDYEWPRQGSIGCARLFLCEHAHAMLLYLW